MAKSAVPLLLAGGAALLFLSKKKKKRPSDFVFDDEVITAGAGSAPSEGVVFSPNMGEFDIGATWRIRILDQWLNNRRLSGELATVDHNAGWLYTLLVDDPSTFLGDISGLGKTGGSVIYGGLWLMATAGIGIYASGFASTGASIQAATQAANATRAMQILGPRATQLAGTLYKKGFGSSQIALALMDFGGTNQMKKFGVSKAIVALSAGAAGLGASMSAALLAETGVDAAFSPDLAASAIESAAEFSLQHNVSVAGVEVPIALLPSSDEFPAVQELNKLIMNYIIKFQKRHFTD